MSLSDLKRWLAEHIWVRPLGSVLLLASLLLLFPLRHLLAGFRQLDLRVVAAAVPLFLLVHLVGALKWHMLVRRSGTPLSVVESIQCYYFGLFGNVFLPSVVGGDTFMVALAVQKTEKRAGILVASFLNRALDLLALLLLAAGAVRLIPGSLTAPFRRTFNRTLAVAAVGVLLCAAAAAVAFRPSRSSGGLRRFLEKHSDAFQLLRSPKRILAPLAFSILIQFCLIAVNVWVAAASGLHLPWAAWLFSWPLAKLASLLPVAAGGIGARELALVALLTPFGAPAGQVVATGLAWEVIRALGGVAGGAIWKGIGWWARPAGGRG
jgi:uncharacterized membrane protein YbhN (UPF0104 family)